jgi:hypothetical protein
MVVSFPLGQCPGEIDKVDAKQEFPPAKRDGPKSGPL